MEGRRRLGGRLDPLSLPLLRSTLSFLLTDAPPRMNKFGRRSNGYVQRRVAFAARQCQLLNQRRAGRFK